MRQHCTNCFSVTQPVPCPCGCLVAFTFVFSHATKSKRSGLIPRYIYQIEYFPRVQSMSSDLTLLLNKLQGISVHFMLLPKHRLGIQSFDPCQQHILILLSRCSGQTKKNCCNWWTWEVSFSSLYPVSYHQKKSEIKHLRLFFPGNAGTPTPVKTKQTFLNRSEKKKRGLLG